MTKIVHLLGNKWDRLVRVAMREVSMRLGQKIEYWACACRSREDGKANL